MLLAGNKGFGVSPRLAGKVAGQSRKFLKDLDDRPGARSVNIQLIPWYVESETSEAGSVCL